jgi:hypothetical protein
MKKLILMLSLFKVIAIGAVENERDSILLAEYIYADSVNSVIKYFGMAISDFNSGSGFKSGTEAAIYAKGRNKSMELGAYFDDETRTLSGLTMNYKWFILKNYFDKQGVIEPYIFYSFIYRATTYDKPLTMYPERLKYLKLEDKYRYNSIEHMFGIGLEVNLLNYMYINCCAGFGKYLGSIKKPVCYDQNYGKYQGSNGWGGYYKFGLGVRIP